MCPLCVTVTAIVGVALTRMRRRKQPDPARWQPRNQTTTSG